MANQNYFFLGATKDELYEQEFESNRNKHIINFRKNTMFFEQKRMKECKSLVDFENSPIFENGLIIGPVKEDFAITKEGISQKFDIIQYHTETKLSKSVELLKCNLEDEFESFELSSGVDSDFSQRTRSEISESSDFTSIDSKFNSFSTSDITIPEQEPQLTNSEHSFQVEISDLINFSILRDQILREIKQKAKRKNRKEKKAKMQQAAEYELSLLENEFYKFISKPQNSSNDSYNFRKDNLEISEEFIEKCLFEYHEQTMMMIKVSKSALDLNLIQLQFAEENIPILISESLPIRIVVDLINYSGEAKSQEPERFAFIIFTLPIGDDEKETSDQCESQKQKETENEMIVW